jgi:hypothetical protein
MNTWLKILTLATTGAVLAGLPGSGVLAQRPTADTNATGRAFIIPETESFRTKAVQLENYRPRPHNGAAHPGRMYSFVLHGTARPGVVAIEVLDSNGTAVERTTGRLTSKGGEGRPREGSNQRPWQPKNFKMLGFTEGSVVKVDKLTAGAGLTITIAGEKEWAVVTTIGKIRKKP